MEETEVEPSVYDTVVSLLNEASASRDQTLKLECLRKVQELIVYRDAALIDNFLDEILGFQHESVEIKKFLLGFTELACKKDPEIISKVVANLAFFFTDENINVRKKVIVTLTGVYPTALKWVAKMRTITGAVEQTWEYLSQLKNRLIPLLDDENDGIRTYIIKFMEACVISQSCKSSDFGKDESSMIISLDQIPRDHKLISYRRLESEAKSFFQKMLDVLAYQHVSSVNLMTCMNALVNIARLRTDFLERVILAFETLHVNLPPTLAKSQVSSVRKALKGHLLTLLRLPAALPFQPQMTTLLTDLGATQAQVVKALPASSDLRKRIRRVEDESGMTGDDADASGSKRNRLDDEEDDGFNPDEYEGKGDEKRRNNAIDITGEYLFAKLTPSNVADLVLLSMIVLPDVMPPQFQSSFTPIAAAGTEAQIRHLSRLMATQFTALGIGPGAEQVKKLAEKASSSKADETLAPATVFSKKDEALRRSKENTPAALVSKAAQEKEKETALANDEAAKKPPPAPLVPAGAVPGVKTSKRFHQFGLAHITKPMDPATTQRMTLMAFDRIMKAEKRVINGGASMAHSKILIAIVSEFNNPKLTESLLSCILSDQKSRSDMAIMWLYHEYSCYQQFIHTVTQSEDQAYEKYDQCLSSLLSNLLNRGEHKESLFHKILLEAPLITPNSLDILKRACLDPVHGSLSLITLREMILTRPQQRDEILCALIDFTCYEKIELRQQSLEIAKELFVSAPTRSSVYKYVIAFLQSLLESVPPNNLFGLQKGRRENPGRWEEDSIKACLYLYLYLLPVDYSLIHQLAEVYVQTGNETKRVILRLIETPIKAANAQSPELMSLIENFPKGAETLVTKIVNLLTERNPPTLDLVKRVRNLYLERVSDVRFLIPVLAGLHKREIIAALPKLIKLNANIVKEVFNRILHGKNLETGHPPLNAVELIVALGQIDFGTSVEDGKYVIAALEMLLSDFGTCSKDSVAGAIQTLSECVPMPALIMRIILRALSFHPSLVGFSMIILQRLIGKQIWKQPTVWEGFIKCCLKTRPQSLQVLMQLPVEQLMDLFDVSSELKSSMINHVKYLMSTNQKYKIPANIMEALKCEFEQTDQGPALFKSESEPTRQRENIVLSKVVVKEELLQQQQQNAELENSIIVDAVKTPIPTDMETPPPVEAAEMN